MGIIKGRKRVNFCEMCFKEIYNKDNNALYCKECAIIRNKQREQRRKENGKRKQTI